MARSCALPASPSPSSRSARLLRASLARLAWHIGNRHADVQVVGGTMRIRRDHVLEERGLGARLTPVEASFDPEHGAYEHHQHGHDH
jgi:urease accessory protein